MNRFQSTLNRIRNAKEYQEALEVMDVMKPVASKKLCESIAIKYGREIGELYSFEDYGFKIVCSEKSELFSLYRWKGDEEMTLLCYDTDGSILEFKPMEVWKVYGFLEEIEENGKLEI